MKRMTDQHLKENGYRNYKGTEIDVYYNIDLCAHAGKCVKGSIEVFNPKRKQSLKKIVHMQTLYMGTEIAY